ncbi:hypothetical protein BASA81_005312 [Batrachochytrium salamandrivorans]|nr:hypothetical protein BASA81_005312 [Batrachochytrium salamandrivorans]
MSQSLPELIPKATYDAYVLPPGKQLRITIPVRLPNQEKRRNLANLKELVAHLELAFPTAHVLPLVFHELHFTAQVAVMYHTDVLLGVHGGAMTNMLFLQPNKGLVLELHPQSSVAHCYQNMAQHAGIPYRKLLVDDSSGESKPNVQQVSQLVKELFAAYR